jgi:hypothetical protein
MPRFGWRSPRLIRLLAALVVLALFIPISGPAFADNSADYAISGGWFFTETGGGNGNGFAVRDAGTDANGHTIKFWSEFQRLGGIATLGYPVAEPYVGSDGFNYQAFQRGILQWRPEIQSAYLSNTFQQLQDAGKDDWLLEVKGIPKPITDDGSGGDYSKAVTIRLGWLTNNAIKAYFLANPNPSTIASWGQDQSITLYGLPMSAPQQEGPFIVQRFQRFAIQLWTNSVAGMPAPGSVVGVLGGDLVKESGLLPANAVQALGPNATPTQPAPAATPTPAPAPPTPNYPWYVANQQGWPNCGTTYMLGYTWDANGNGVNGMAVKSWNDWGNVNIAGSRNYQGKDGYWDRVIHTGVSAGKWYVQVVDGSGNPASNVAVVNFTGSCDPSTNPVQQAEVDFKSH